MRSITYFTFKTRYRVCMSKKRRLLLRTVKRDGYYYGLYKETATSSGYRKRRLLLLTVKKAWLLLLQGTDGLFITVTTQRQLQEWENSVRFGGRKK